MRAQANLLGDLRAEADHRMLDTAFLETADYKTLIETSDRPIVIGRRGTGKSALAYRLLQHWRTVSRADAILITPFEEQIIGLRAMLLEFFSAKYGLLRAGARIAWRYALLAEIAQVLTHHYKVDRSKDADVLRAHANAWDVLGSDISARLRRKFRDVGQRLGASEMIAEIASLFDLGRLNEAVGNALTEMKHHIVVLIDKVDEGYEPDDVGVAMVDALVLAR
jgi:hypothetical protein